jgi:hypothetical protein
MPMCDAHEIVLGHSRKMAPGEGYWLAADAIRESAIHSLGLSRIKESRGVAAAYAWAYQRRHEDTPWLLCEICVKYLGLARADEEGARQAAQQWSHNRSTPGYNPEQRPATQYEQAKTGPLIPLTPEEEAASTGSDEGSPAATAYPVLIDALCCMMCAGGQVNQHKSDTVINVLTKANVPLKKRDIEAWVVEFVGRARRNGLEEMVRDSLIALGKLRTSAEKELIWQCIREAAMAEGVLEQRGRQMCQDFAAVLWEDAWQRSLGAAPKADTDKTNETL